MTRMFGWRTRIGIIGGVLAAATLGTLSFTTPSPGAGKRQCSGRTATIVGTSAGDVIYGTNGTDVIVGGRGNDQIFGLGGDDWICGEGGRDILNGGSGDDYLDGGSGPDAIFAGSGDDVLFGGAQSDQLHGGSGEDYMGGDGVTLNYPGDICDGGDGTNDTALSDCETKQKVP